MAKLPPGPPARSGTVLVHWPSIFSYMGMVLSEFSSLTASPPLTPRLLEQGAAGPRCWSHARRLRQPSVSPIRHLGLGWNLDSHCAYFSKSAMWNHKPNW